MESARPADETDVSVIVDLAATARAELAPQRGGRVALARLPWTIASAAEVATSVSDPDTLVALGCIDGCAVGYAMVTHEAINDGSVLGRIHELYVLPDARGVGVGEALLELVLAWAAERGCSGIDAVALPGARATKNFFETFAMVARAIVVHRPLALGDRA